MALLEELIYKVQGLERNVAVLLGSGSSGLANNEALLSLTNVTDQTLLSHGLGTRMGLNVGDYYLEIRVYDSDKQVVSGISATKFDKDQIVLNFSQTDAVFTGTIFVKAMYFG